uniref:Uncharacterized protein n=1 Tax=Nelumbo nucifera TaxID=4432 RepID=A0A822ZBF1_NELNU|nr:TPA_asm: hypothetical protein HUJ06_000682 [Nelumbo nucifera]
MPKMTLKRPKWSGYEKLRIKLVNSGFSASRHFDKNSTQSSNSLRPATEPRSIETAAIFTTFSLGFSAVFHCLLEILLVAVHHPH